ncbi:MAG: hypothetical protein D6719_01585 [Candidatus Dadabacteria bacterium]|nr:MAG: hypothetical protein D6719_01585 [Candidatus Dadabacteria bacterium]
MISLVPDLPREVNLLIATLSSEHIANFSEHLYGSGESGRAELTGTVDTTLGSVALKLEERWGREVRDSRNLSELTGRLEVIEQGREILLTGNQAALIADRLADIKAEYVSKVLKPYLENELTKLGLSPQSVIDVYGPNWTREGGGQSSEAFSISPSGTPLTVIVEKKDKKIAGLIPHTVYRLTAKAEVGYVRHSISVESAVAGKVFEIVAAFCKNRQPSDELAS